MRSLGQQGYLLKRRLPYETVDDPYQSLMSKRTMDDQNKYRDSTIDLGNRQNDLREKQFNDQKDDADDAEKLSEWGLGLSSADLLTRILPWKSAIGGPTGALGTGAGLPAAGAVALPFAVLAAVYGILNAAGEMEHSDEPVSAYRLAIDQGIIPDQTSDQAVQYRKYLENMFMAPNPNQDLSQEGGGFGGGGEMQSGILMPGSRELIDDFMANPRKYLDTGADLVDPFVNVSTPIRQNYMNSQVGNSLWMPQAGLSQEGGGVTGAGTLTGYSNTNFGGNWWDNPSP